MTHIRINDKSFDGVQFRRMSDEQCEKVHSASLEILERTGAMLYEQRAIDLLKKAGAFVSDGNRVRIPSVALRVRNGRRGVERADRKADRPRDLSDLADIEFHARSLRRRRFVCVSPIATRAAVAIATTAPATHTASGIAVSAGGGTGTIGASPDAT